MGHKKYLNFWTVRHWNLSTKILSFNQSQQFQNFSRSFFNFPKSRKSAINYQIPSALTKVVSNTETRISKRVHSNELGNRSLIEKRWLLEMLKLPRIISGALGRKVNLSFTFLEFGWPIEISISLQIGGGRMSLKQDLKRTFFLKVAFQIASHLDSCQLTQSQLWSGCPKGPKNE